MNITAKNTSICNVCPSPTIGRIVLADFKAVLVKGIKNKDFNKCSTVGIYPNKPFENCATANVAIVKIQYKGTKRISRRTKKPFFLISFLVDSITINPLRAKKKFKQKETALDVCSKLETMEK